MPNPMKKNIKINKVSGAWRIANFAIVAAIFGLIVFELSLLSANKKTFSEASVLSTVVAMAQAEPQAPAASGEASGGDADQVSICNERIKAFAEVNRDEFGKFMNTHFAQTKPTSELINEAMEKYREYRQKLKDKVNSYGRDPTTATLKSLNADISGCPQALSVEFELLEAMMREHILKNAYAKKSLLLIKKYESINEKLEKLNFSVADMYANFGRFSQKLPCYTEKCTR